MLQWCLIVVVGWMFVRVVRAILDTYDPAIQVARNRWRWPDLTHSDIRTRLAQIDYDRLESFEKEAGAGRSESVQRS
jgi:hypothetical protein